MVRHFGTTLLVTVLSGCMSHVHRTPSESASTELRGYDCRDRSTSLTILSVKSLPDRRGLVFHEDEEFQGPLYLGPGEYEIIALCKHKRDGDCGPAVDETVRGTAVAHRAGSIGIRCVLHGLAVETIEPL